MKKTNNTLVCQECGGTNIHIKAWVDANTLEYVDGCSDGDTEDNWCEDCGDHLNIITYQEFKENQE